MLNDTIVKSVTIANGAALSSVLETPETYYLAGILKDTTLDTSVAITFQVSMDNVTFYTLRTTGGANVGYTVQAATAEAMIFPRDTFFAWEYIKIAVADNQTGITTIQCVLKQY